MGNPGHFRCGGSDPSRNQSFADFFKRLGRADHFPGGAVVAQVLGAGIEDDAHHFFFVRRFLGDHNIALAVEHPVDRPVLGHVAAVLREHVANFADDPVAIAGDHLHEHTHSAGAVALEHHFIERFTLELPGAALDGAFDIVVGHVLALGREDGCAQARIGVRVGAADAGGNGQLANNLGENFAALGVSRGLLMLDCGPL